MPTPTINTNKSKEENFEAISPKAPAPMLISTTHSRRGFGKMGWFFVLLFFVAVAAAAYLYKELDISKTKVTELENEVKSSSANIQSMPLLEKVARHIILPGEEPKVTVIGDAENLKKNQPLYTAVRNGDYLITYSNVEIVYNENSDRVVHVRMVTQTASAPEPTQVAGAETRATQGPVSIDIRNGAGVAGLAARTAETLKGISDYQVKTIGNAAKSTYNTTIIINLTGKNVAGLEKQFKTTAMNALPVGEAKSSSDVVIIVGKQ